MLNFLTKKENNKILPKITFALGIISTLFIYTYYLGNTNNKELNKFNQLVLDTRKSLDTIEVIKEDVNDVRFYLYNFKYKDDEDYYSLFNKNVIDFENDVSTLKSLSENDEVELNNIAHLEKAYDQWLINNKSKDEDRLFQELRNKLNVLQDKENERIKIARIQRAKSSSELYNSLNNILLLSIVTIVVSYIVILRQTKVSNSLEQSLDDTQTIFYKFMDSTSNVAWIKNKDSRILYVNKRFREIFGNEGFNKTDHEWLPLHIADVERGNDIAILTTNKSIQSQQTIEDKDHKFRTWLLDKFKLDLVDEIFIGGTATEITKMVEAEKLLEAMNSELRVSNEEIQQFIYIASHDLQEPIRMVYNYVQLLENYLNTLNVSDEKLDKYTKFIVAGSKRMKVLVDDVLQYSRAGTKDVNYENININNIVSNILVLLSPTIEETKAVIEVDDFPDIIGNYSQIEQVFTNLISNAAKFISKTSPLIRVTYTDNDKYHLFKVIDNGIGIDPKYFTIIFEVFKRLHKKEDYPGTGIGLAICKKIIKKHGGEIWVESQLGAGTTFCFTIPKKDDHENISD